MAFSLGSAGLAGRLLRFHALDMLRACLVSLPAAPVIDPSLRGGIGGTETRAWLFARLLDGLPDTEITFVVRHRRPLTIEKFAGITIRTQVDPLFNLYEQVGMSVERIPQFPGLRFRRWTPQLLWQLPWLVLRRMISPKSDPQSADGFYKDIPANVFCTFGVQSNSARVIASAHSAGKPAVLVLGSDGDVDERFLGDPQAVNPYGDRAGVCRWILQEADAIVCQTEEQRSQLRARFQREGVVISNPLLLADWDTKLTSFKAPSEDSGFVLWVGRAESLHKRPMQCIEIARRTPEISYLMVMNPRDADEAARVRRSAPPNVSFLEFVSPNEMPALMARAAVFLNTSSLEGFPNTFLQAAAARRPVVSLAVGEEYLTASGAGAFAGGEIDRAAELIRGYIADQHCRKETGERARAWVARHHDGETQARLLREVLSETRRPQATSHTL